MGRYKLLALLTVLCFIFSFTLPANSQSTYGSISGVVSDTIRCCRHRRHRDRDQP